MVFIGNEMQPLKGDKVLLTYFLELLMVYYPGFIKI